MDNEGMQKAAKEAGREQAHRAEVSDMRHRLNDAESRISDLIDALGRAYGSGYLQGLEHGKALGEAGLRSRD